MTLYGYAKSIGLNPLVALAIFANCEGIRCDRCPIKGIGCATYSVAKAKEYLCESTTPEAITYMLKIAKEIEVNIKNKE